LLVPFIKVTIKNKFYIFCNYKLKGKSSLIKIASIKYFENRDMLEKKLQESETYRTTYELNKKIIDFNNIPEELVQEFMGTKF
jgi:hypothetical protein